MLKSPFEITLRFKILADKGTPLDFEKAARILKIRKPTETWKSGDPLSRSQHQRAALHDAIWYEIEWSLQDRILQPSIERMLDHLEGLGPMGAEFFRSYSCELSFTILLYYRGRNAPMDVPGMHIGVDTARHLAELGVEIDMDMYLLSNDAKRRADKPVIERV